MSNETPSGAGDDVHAALRVLEEQEAKLALLRAAFIRGEETGVTDRNVLDILAAVKEQSAATDK